MSINAEIDPFSRPQSPPDSDAGPGSGPSTGVRTGPNDEPAGNAMAVAAEVRLTTQACPRFVEFVEAGVTGGEELMSVAREYLAPIQQARVDTLILGCTHYPLLTGVISHVLGDGVNLVSSSEACARDVYSELTRRGLVHSRRRQASRRFLTTGDPADFQGIAERLLGNFVADVEPVSLAP